MMGAAEQFLSQMLEENAQLANQAERMRLVVATGNLCLATALQMAIAFLGLEARALLLAVWLLPLGIYGCFALSKLHERETYHRARVRALRARLDMLCPDAEVAQLFRLVEEKQTQAYPRLMNLRLNTIWLVLQGIIVVFGVTDSLLCLLR